MRTKELDRLVSHVKSRETVRIVGRREFGRTTLLHHLAETLTAQGFVVRTLAGDAALASVKYGALRDQLISADRLGQCSTPHDVRNVIEVTLTHAPNTVLLVDDAEELDPATAEALAPLVSAQRITAVMVTAPFDQLTRAQRKAAHALRAAARLEIGALSFEETGLLGQELLQAPVSSALVAEIFALSSGIAGIAADVIRAARADGKLQKSRGRWALGTEGLWTQHLEETAERLLAPLETGPLFLMHALAVAGSLPADGFHALDPPSAMRLTDLGLVTMFVDPHGALQASPRPALLTDYFRFRPLDLTHTEALEMLNQAVKSGTIAGSKKEYKLGSQTIHIDSDLTHNAGLARYLRDQNDRELGTAAQKWRARPTAAHGLRYLEALLGSPNYSIVAPQLLARTNPADAGDETLLQLALHELGLARASSAQELRYGAELRARAPKHADALEALSMYFRFCDEGLSTTVTQWLAADHADPLGFAETIATHIRVCSGTPSSTAEGGHSSPAIPLQRIIAEQTALIAHIWRARSGEGRESGALRAAGRGREATSAPSLTDLYIRAHEQAAHGRPSEARETLSQALAIGGLDLRYAPVYAATLRWSAYLHFQEGGIDVAEALLNESENYAAVTGPLPGMRPEFGACLKALFAGDAHAASVLLLAEAEACAQRSFIDASWAMAKLAFELAPSEEALRKLEALAVHAPYASARQLTAFARAALHRSPSLTTHIASFRHGTDLSAAADLLDAADRQPHEHGERASKEYALAAAEARQKLSLVREPLARRFGRSPGSDLDLLTPREREIAPLTVTLTNREIAERLTLSIRTVENHIARAMKKLGVTSRSGLNAALSPSSLLLPPLRIDVDKS